MTRQRSFRSLWGIRILAVVAVVQSAGCATITGSETQNLSLQATDPAGMAVPGADCKLTNDKGTWRAKPPTIVVVNRSAEDLLVQCDAERQPAGTLRAISRANSGMIGNILFGGGIGAMIDHTKGTAYDYPSMLSVVFGTARVIDKQNEQGDAPRNPPPPQGAPSSVAAAGPSAVLPLAPGTDETGLNGLPAAGTVYRYAWRERQYSRQQEFAVRILAQDGSRVSEAFEPGNGGPTEVRIDARRQDFLDRRLGDGQALLEFAPYLALTAGAGMPAPSGPFSYPAGGYDPWNISATSLERDDVGVPAGNYTALRVEVRGSRRTFATANARDAIAERFLYEAWYAPELKRYVKLRHRRWNGYGAMMGDEQVELLLVGRE